MSDPGSTSNAGAPAKPGAERFDVLIVGAGISGVGAGCHLTRQCPGTTFVILETKDTFGGTWVTHRYPGIRSDSDLYAFGYRFKPWVGPPIATGAEILSYMGGGHRGSRPRNDRPLRVVRYAEVCAGPAEGRHGSEGSHASGNGSGAHR